MEAPLVRPKRFDERKEQISSLIFSTKILISSGDHM